MSGKYANKKRSRNQKSTRRKKSSPLTTVLLVIAIVLVLIVAVMLFALRSGLLAQPTPTEANTEAATTQAQVQETQAQSTDAPVTPETTVVTEPPYLPMELGQGLTVTDIGAYTGAYVEDGTDEVVADVLMVIVENTSEEALQYARLTMQFGDRTAEFAITTLPAGQKVVLLEQNRMEYADLIPDGAELHDVVFTPELELYQDIFEITGTKGNLTVKNISETAVSGDIYVYYKNSAQDILYGGITYRAKVEGGLEPGESKRILAAHYNPTGSAILMVTYVP